MQNIKFLHIPKTAGTTFNFILGHQYRNHQQIFLTGDFDADSKCLQNLDPSTRYLFMGHTPYRLNHPLIDEALTLTFLRDPIERTQSFCQHVFEGKSPYLRESFPPESFDLDHFLDSGCDELENLQTKVIINHACNYQDSQKINSLSEKEALDLALDRLFNEIDAYGLQEYFDESLLLFWKPLNWHLPYYHSKNLKNPTKPLDFSEAQLTKIKRLNRIDLQLYQAAQTRFLKKIHSSSAKSHQLKIFRFINSHAIPLLRNSSATGVGKKARAFGRSLFAKISH